MIEKNTHRMAQIIQDLLQLSQLEANKKIQDRFMPVPIQPVINSSIQLCQEKATQKGISIQYQDESGNAQILGSNDLLNQVMTNLVDNAIKYSDENGNIQIRSRILAGVLRVSVQDDGPGIDPKHADRVFQRFYRTDKARSRDKGGTGLGLAIVKHIIQGHNGQIHLEHPDSGGASFVITLPLL